MSFWKKKSFWKRECGLGVIFLIMSLVVFIRTHNFERSLTFFVEIFVLMQPVLLLAYFIDRKFSGRGKL
jgi:hypothetical protein